MIPHFTKRPRKTQTRDPLQKGLWVKTSESARLGVAQPPSHSQTQPRKRTLDLFWSDKRGPRICGFSPGAGVLLDGPNSFRQVSGVFARQYPQHVRHPETSGPGLLPQRAQAHVRFLLDERNP